MTSQTGTSQCIQKALNHYYWCLINQHYWQWYWQYWRTVLTLFTRLSSGKKNKTCPLLSHRTVEQLLPSGSFFSQLHLIVVALFFHVLPQIRHSIEWICTVLPRFILFLQYKTIIIILLYLHLQPFSFLIISLHYNFSFLCTKCVSIICNVLF